MVEGIGILGLFKIFVLFTQRVFQTGGFLIGDIYLKSADGVNYVNKCEEIHINIIIDRDIEIILYGIHQQFGTAIDIRRVQFIPYVDILAVCSSAPYLNIHITHERCHGDGLFILVYRHQYHTVRSAVFFFTSGIRTYQQDIRNAFAVHRTACESTVSAAPAVHKGDVVVKQCVQADKYNKKQYYQRPEKLAYRIAFLVGRNSAAVS